MVTNSKTTNNPAYGTTKAWVLNQIKNSASSGAQGAQGRQGTQGVQGDLGVQGTDGTNAGQGAQGRQGIQGGQHLIGKSNVGNISDLLTQSPIRIVKRIVHSQ